MNYLNDNTKRSYFSENPLKNIVKGVVVILLFTFTQCSLAQVGVGNTNPQATLDISATNATSPADNDGILIPRMSAFPSSPGATRDGMLIFDTGTGASGKGFYYWDGTTSTWIFLSSGGKNTLDEAYDEGGPGAGRTITADNGAVTIDGGDASLRISGALGGSGKTGIQATYVSTSNQSITGISQLFNNTANGNFNSTNGLTNYFQNVETTANGISNSYDNYNLPAGRLLRGFSNYYSGGNFTFAYGFINTLAPAFTTNGNYIGYGNTIQSPGSGNRTGFEANISGTGSGNKYGLNVNIDSGAGGTHYGVYTVAQKSNSYAGYFLGRFSIGTATTNNYILPSSRGNNGYVIQSTGGSGTDWVDPDTIGTDNQTIDNFSFNTSTNILTLEIEDDGIPAQTVDLSSLSTSDSDWYEEGTSTGPNNINDNIFTQGRVGIGDNAPDASLDVNYSGSDIQATIVDFSTTSNLVGTTSATIPAGFKANTTATTTNRQLASGLFSLSGSMANGTSTSAGIAIQNLITTQSETYGLTVTVDGESNTSYGTNNNVTSSPSNINFGTYNQVTGATNSNYGGWYRANGNSTTNYGIRAEAFGGTTNWAGYFGSGNVYVQNELQVDGNINYADGNEALGNVLTSDALGNASWTNPASIFTDTDNQTIDTFSFNTSTNILTLEIEDDGIPAQTVNLSSLVQTDEIDWYEESTTTKPNNINDDIYTLGYVAIGKNTANYSLDVQDTSAGVTRGININKTDNSGSETSGLYITKTGNGTGRSHGIFTDVTGIGTGQKYGVFNRITSSANGSQYGTRNFINGNTSSNQFGVFNNLANDGTGDIYGTYNGMRVTSPRNMHGVYNEFNTANSGSILITGVRNRFTDGTPGSDGFSGIYTDFALTANGTYYGVRNEYSNGATGTGEKYGSYNLIPTAAGGTHYGVYSNVTKSNSYAGYFLGQVSVGTTTANNYILPASRGTNGQVMTTNGAGIVSWQTPTTGDITAVTAGTGLTGGGTIGNLTINAVGNNGLTTNANDIRLGGTLIQNTTIAQGNNLFNLNLNGTGDFNIQEDGTNKLTVLDNGDTVLGGDLYWRDENTGGAILGRFIDDVNDGHFQIYENGVVSIDLDANGTSVFNEQGLDRDFRIESNTETDMFRVDAANNRIGIGTATPDGMLDIEGNSTGTVAQLELTETQANDGARIRFNNGVETDNHWTLYGYADNTEANSRFNLFFSDIGGTGTGGNIITVTGSGQVGIRDGAPTYALELPNNALANTGRGRANAWVTYSDNRVKKNQQKLNYGLYTILKMQPKSYLHYTSEFINNQLTLIEGTENESIGFIAQELYEILPEVVSKPEDENTDLWSVDYQKIVPVAVKAIQELNTKVESLETENAILKAKLQQLESLEARLTALENNTETSQVNKIGSKE